MEIACHHVLRRLSVNRVLDWSGLKPAIVSLLSTRPPCPSRVVPCCTLNVQSGKTSHRCHSTSR